MIQIQDKPLMLAYAGTPVYWLLKGVTLIRSYDG